MTKEVAPVSFEVAMEQLRRARGLKEINEAIKVAAQAFVREKLHGA